MIAMIILYKNEPQIKAPRVTPLEGVSTYALQGIRVRGVENTQDFGIDERRFIDMANQIYSCIEFLHEKILHLRLGTRMTWIRRIFTDPCVSASSVQSVFYRYCVNCASAFSISGSESL